MKVYDINKMDNLNWDEKAFLFSIDTVNIEVYKVIHKFDEYYAVCMVSGDKTKCAVRYMDEFDLDKDHKLTYFLNNLTEDVEQAKWQLEFGNIIRTETLRLPSWEEFKSQDKRIHFSDPMHRYSYYGYTDLRRIEIKEYCGQNGNVIFSKPSTEPNYIEACRLCKKLFLGE